MKPRGVRLRRRGYSRLGYNLYITRKDEWFDEHGPEIEMEEWVALVGADPGMEMRSEAVADLPDGSQLVAQDPTMAVWLAPNGDGRMWFHMFQVNIVGKNPSPEAIKKMHALSVTLSAVLIGDDGEHYDADGTTGYPDFPDADGHDSGELRKPWWKFW